MFTGIITHQGKILKTTFSGKQARLCIQPFPNINDHTIGESIAINGVCLTVENFDKNYFETYVSEETLSITNIKKLTNGDFINLERALKPTDRIGGHFVTGHVDTMAIIKNLTKKEDSHIIQLSYATQFSKYIVKKGSIALDGVSLTVNERGSDFLIVNIIPATFNNTNIKNWHPGCQINMETDFLGKYIFNFLHQGESSLTISKLQKYGFLENNNAF